MQNKIIILVSVRLDSKRLKNKALKNVSNIPLIIYLFKYLKRNNKYKIILCTTKNKLDDKIESIAKKNNIEVFRGSDKNVAHRFIKAAHFYKSKIIIRVTGDNPFTNPYHLKKMTELHVKSKNDYTYCDQLPIGTTGEIITVKALEECYKLIEDKNSSEYLSWMINRPDIFKVGRYYPTNKNYNYPKISLTVDKINDLKKINKIIEISGKDYPSLTEIIEIYKKNFNEVSLNYISNLIIKQQHNVNFRLKKDKIKKLPVVAIVQARMNSKRMPFKVLSDIAGKPMLLRVLERVSRSKLLDDIVVATSYQKQDDEIAELCNKYKFKIFRGHPYDVLQRYYKAAKKYNAKIIVRITADCPIVDWEIIDQIINQFLKLPKSIGYGSNRLVRTYPIGTDVEIFSLENLMYANTNCKKYSFREHVTPFMYDRLSPQYLYSMSTKKLYKDIRLTVDTEKDLELINIIYENMKDKNSFRWKDVINFLKKNKKLINMNKNIKQTSYHKYDPEWNVK